MRQIYLIILALVSTLFVQIIFADDAMMSSNSSACAAISKACQQTGFSRNSNGDKKFWFSCMKPIILGQAVKGVAIDSITVRNCRMDKIKALKQEFDEFNNASGT